MRFHAQLVAGRVHALSVTEVKKLEASASLIQTLQLMPLMLFFTYLCAWNSECRQGALVLDRGDRVGVAEVREGSSKVIVP